MTAGDAEVVRSLVQRLGEDAVVDDRDLLASYRHDQAPTIPAGEPLVAVLPSSTADVRAVVAVAREHRRPLVPRGAGSGLSGGANAIDGCIVVSLTRMDRIVEVHADDLYAVVEPGVLNADLRTAAAEHGLHYPPDPASFEFSTLGGNLATNAGGLCCVKYGVTRDFVLGLEVVLADATAVAVGRRTVKGVAGYDLTGLFVGSEGTLGIITQAMLRLVPAPHPPITLVAFFADLAAAGAAVAQISSAGVVPSLLEVLDRTTIRAVDDWKRMGLDRDAEALLLAQSDAGGTQAEWEVARLARACEQAGATYVAQATDPAEGEMLMAARRLAYPALERQGAVLLDDVAVPRSRIPDLIAAVREIGTDLGVLIGTFGHVGDGNMHPTLVWDPDDREAAGRAQQAFRRIVEVALELGGTSTGEHGVGVLKRDFLRREAGPIGHGIHAAVKSALDPLGILNPGKVVWLPDGR